MRFAVFLIALWGFSANAYAEQIGFLCTFAMQRTPSGTTKVHYSVDLPSAPAVGKYAAKSELNREWSGPADAISKSGTAFIRIMSANANPNAKPLLINRATGDLVVEMPDGLARAGTCVASQVTHPDKF